MNGFRNPDQEQAIRQMTHVILTEILERVLREFESTTGTQIGAVHIQPAEPASGNRQVEIEVRHADGGSLEALMKYKQILCDYESFMEEAFCNTSFGESGPEEAEDI